MNLKELQTKNNLKEEHIFLLFDMLYTYHEFDMLYSFDLLEDLFTATKYFDKPDTIYLKAHNDLLDLNLIEFVNDGEAKFFIANEDIRGKDFLIELEMFFQIRV